MPSPHASHALPKRLSRPPRFFPLSFPAQNPHHLHSQPTPPPHYPDSISSQHPFHAPSSLQPAKVQIISKTCKSYIIIPKISPKSRTLIPKIPHHSPQNPTPLSQNSRDLHHPYRHLSPLNSPLLSTLNPQLSTLSTTRKRINASTHKRKHQP